MEAFSIIMIIGAIIVILIIISLLYKMSSDTAVYFNTKFVSGGYASDEASVDDAIYELLDRVPDYPEFMLLELELDNVVVPPEDVDESEEIVAYQKTSVTVADRVYNILYRNTFNTNKFVTLVWDNNLAINEEIISAEQASASIRNEENNTLKKQNYLGMSFSKFNYTIFLIAGGGDTTQYAQIPDFFQRKFMLYGGFGTGMNIKSSMSCPHRLVMPEKSINVARPFIPFYIYQDKKASFPIFSSTYISDSCLYYSGSFYIDQ